MFYNMQGFGFVDDMQDHQASIKKLQSLSIRKIYPGHGKPFLPNAKMKAHSQVSSK
jgi:glyoxylase-like metal-dependent hydrolase (beta-lactamase superfamily II)